MGNSSESNKKQKLKISIFNKTYKDMQKEIKSVMKRTQHPSFSVTSIEELECFSSQLTSNINLYNDKDQDLLSKVDLLDKFFESKPTLSSANVDSVWKYLEIMYSVSSGKKKEAVKKPEPFDMTKIGSLVTDLMNDENSGMSDLITNISTKLEDTLSGKDVDQQKLIADLLSGNTESSGINFSDIIAQTTSALKDKIDSGEVDIEKIKQIASNLK